MQSIQASLMAGSAARFPTPAAGQRQAGVQAPAKPSGEQEDLKATFQKFVGQTFYGEMLKAMRSTQGKPAYMHGGRGEEVFQSQLDQVLSEKLAEQTSERLTGPMFELFTLTRR